MNKSVLTSALLFGFGFMLASCTERSSSQGQASLSFIPRQYAQQIPRLTQQPAAINQTDPKFLSYCLFEDVCLLGELPVLGHFDANLTRAAIMQRVWTDEPWMQLRMREVLNALPDAYIPLFGAVTAIAITDSLPYPYYRSLNGAIYIPASFLWQTLEERDSLDFPPDRRVPDPRLTPFTAKWRYLDAKGEDPFVHNHHSYTENRTVQQMLIPFAAMIAHELAHANDFLLATEETLPDELDTFYDAFVAHSESARVSFELAEKYPVNSQVRQAAQEYYYPNYHNFSFLYSSASTLGADFDKTGASSFYGALKIEEDLAMLFEEVMMKEFFDLDRYIAFTEFKGNEDSMCQDFIVKWGERNRFASAYARERAQFVARKILPGYDFSSLFTAIPSATALQADASWCDATGIAETSILQDHNISANKNTWGLPLWEQFIPPSQSHIHPQL